jgi:hypothetical protein
MRRQRGKAEGGDVTPGKAYPVGDVGPNAEYSKREAGPQTGKRRDDEQIKAGFHALTIARMH